MIHFETLFMICFLYAGHFWVSSLMSISTKRTDYIFFFFIAYVTISFMGLSVFFSPLNFWIIFSYWPNSSHCSSNNFPNFKCIRVISRYSSFWRPFTNFSLNQILFDWLFFLIPVSPIHNIHHPSYFHHRRKKLILPLFLDNPNHFESIQFFSVYIYPFF